MYDLLISFIFLMLVSAGFAWRLDWFRNDYSSKLGDFKLLKFMVLGAILGILFMYLFILFSSLLEEFIPKYIGGILGVICYFSWGIALSKIAKKLTGK